MKWNLVFWTVSELRPTHLLSERRLEDGDFVGVAIYSDGSHLGLYYQAAPDEARHLHLYGHLGLTDGYETKFEHWVIPAVARPRREQVAAFARLVARRYIDGALPYGFSSPIASLDRDGSLRPGGVGLTCASLVLALFYRVGVQILDTSTWDFTDEDTSWQLRWVNGLSRDDSGHATAMLLEIPANRYTPVQVFASSHSDTLPVSQDECEELIEALKTGGDF